MDDPRTGPEAAAPAFSPAGYRALLEALLARGYVVRSFADAEPKARELILRHDIDLALEAALPIAEIEAALGVRASYFVLLRSELYNPFTPRARSALDRIRALGHDVGLHFDAALYDGEDANALDHAAAAECRILEAMTAAPVTMISFHRPAPALLGLDRLLAGRPHAYMPRFFSEMGYCSDSQGRWRYGHPLENGAVAEGRTLQLLTHPIWWTTDAAADPAAGLERFVAHRAAILRKEVVETITPYREAAISESRPRAQRAVIRTLDAETVRVHLAQLIAIAADVDGEYWGAEHFLLDRPDKWTLSFAAWLDAAPIGYAILSRREARHAHLHHFMIARAHRGGGLGRRMLEEMEARASAAGCARLTLKVAEANPRAHGFYERAGFALEANAGGYRTYGKAIGGGRRA